MLQLDLGRIEVVLVHGRVEGDTSRAGMSTDRIPSEDGPWLESFNLVGGITARAELEAEIDAGNLAVEVQQRWCIPGHFPAACTKQHSSTLTQPAAAPQREERVWRSNQYLGLKGGVSARSPEAGPNKRLKVALTSFFLCAVMYACICTRLHKSRRALQCDPGKLSRR